MKLSCLVENQLQDIDQLDLYAAILGESPSRGARSPTLWNRAFSELKTNAMMIPLDVRPENFASVLECLEEDKKFIGGAVAVPFKETTVKWLRSKGPDRLSPEGEHIGAVNCLFRGRNGQLIGTNTDGEAALICIKKLVTSLRDLPVLLLGVGGVGKAIASYVVSELDDPSLLTICARDNLANRQFVGKLDASFDEWPPSDNLISANRLVINCTSIGHRQFQHTGTEQKSMSEFSPLALLEKSNLERTRELISLTAKDCVFFDAVYDPSPTVLLQEAVKQTRKVEDGCRMNLKQAAIAFHYVVTESPSIDQIESFMVGQSVSDV